MYALLQGWEARDILVFANAVSVLKGTRSGGRDDIPRLHEAHTFLIARGEVRIANFILKERNP